jgi:hypothetical protein
MTVYRNSGQMAVRALAALYNLTDRAQPHQIHSNRTIVDEMLRTYDLSCSLEMPKVDHDMHSLLEQYTISEDSDSPLVLFMDGMHHEPEWESHGSGRHYTRFYWANMESRDNILALVGDQDVLFGKRAA